MSLIAESLHRAECARDVSLVEDFGDSLQVEATGRTVGEVEIPRRPIGSEEFRQQGFAESKVDATGLSGGELTMAATTTQAPT